jgi:hypothetical protein
MLFPEDFGRLMGDSPSNKDLVGCLLSESFRVRCTGEWPFRAASGFTLLPCGFPRIRGTWVKERLSSRTEKNTKLGRWRITGLNT